MMFPSHSAKRHHVHILSLAGAEPLNEQGATSSNNQPYGSYFSFGEEIVEKLKGSNEDCFVHLKECLHIWYGCFNNIFQ